MMEQTLGCEYMSQNSHMSAIFGAQHISARQDKCSTIQHDGDMLKRSQRSIIVKAVRKFEVFKLSLV
jgi:hypothetical protein